MRTDEMRAHFRVRPGYWFAPKLYGLGSTPVTWQGWAVVAVAIVLIVAATMGIESNDLKIAVTVPIVLVLGVVCWLKTDGGWRWHWGPRD